MILLSLVGTCVTIGHAVCESICRKQGPPPQACRQPPGLLLMPVPVLYEYCTSMMPAWGRGNLGVEAFICDLNWGE